MTINILISISGINLVNPSPSNSVHTTSNNKVCSFNLADQSPTSDYVDESSVSAPDSSNSSINSPVSFQGREQQTNWPKIKQISAVSNTYSKQKTHTFVFLIHDYFNILSLPRNMQEFPNNFY